MTVDWVYLVATRWCPAVWSIWSKHAGIACLKWDMSSIQPTTAHIEFCFLLWINKPMNIHGLEIICLNGALIVPPCFAQNRLQCTSYFGTGSLVRLLIIEEALTTVVHFLSLVVSWTRGRSFDECPIAVARLIGGSQKISCSVQRQKKRIMTF